MRTLPARSRIILVTGLTILGLLVAGCDPRFQRDFTPLDNYLESVLPRLDGGCALILFEGEETVYRQAFGTFSPDRLVPVASASKWISGGVIAALLDEGLFTLDSRAGEYLSGFPDRKADITIRQMFSHTHGFPEKTPGDFYLPDYLPHRDVSLDSMQAAVDIIADVPLTYPPGTALYYSGMGMQVAGRIAEIVTGKPWVEVFREKIGIPCDMPHTSYYAFGPTRNPNVAGSVRTSLDEYGNFVYMLLSFSA